MQPEEHLNVENVDWKKLSDAVAYYKGLGYYYCELPWLQSRDVLNVTAPTPEHIIGTDFYSLGLIGSAEQAFIGMHQNVAVDPGQFVSCSPCFRIEQIDWLHQTQFMKVELFQTINTTDNGLQNMIQQCVEFYDKYMAKPQVVETSEGFDIEVNGIEVGSYGIRSYRDLTWIYGTGLAEPRFSQAWRAIT